MTRSIIAATALAATCCAAPTSARPVHHSAAAVGDPMAGYYGNTVICAGGEDGRDLCHVWFERDGSMVNIDPSGIHKGHYIRSPVGADGKVRLCFFYDTPVMVIPPEAMAPPPGTEPAGPRTIPRGGLVCTIKDFRSICALHEDVDSLSEEDRRKTRMTIAERFHAGMCYPFAAKQPGDSWYEEDDPMPSQNGIDKLFLVKGHR